MISLTEQVIFRSAFANIINSSLMFLLNNQKIVDLTFFKFFIEYILSTLLTYLLDILFVQKKFSMNNDIEIIPYNNIYKRFNYLFNHHRLFKFVVLFAINIIMNKSIIEFITKLMDKNNIYTDENEIKYRNLFILLFVNLFTGVLYIDILKYNWAYIDNNNILLNIIIYMWFTLSILITVSTNRI